MCESPLTLKEGNIVPCGRCPSCKSAKISGWTLRLMCQDKVSDSSNFITLTYGTGKDKEGIHYPRRTANNLKTVCKRDVQLFLKRLRKLQSKQGGLPIKYYLAAEYGSKTARPHYHAIIFNADKQHIANAWNLGSVHFGNVREASVCYSLKYISKGRTVPRHSRDDRTPEFSLSSQGLGATYLTPAMLRWHRSDITQRVYAVVAGGKKVSLPRYFKDRIYTDQDREQIRLYYQQFHTDQIEYLEHDKWLEKQHQDKQKKAGSIRAANYLNKQNEKI